MTFQSVNATDTDWEIRSFEVENPLAAPFDKIKDLKNGFPSDPHKYITVTVKVTDNFGNDAPVGTTIWVKDNLANPTITYWNNLKQQITPQATDGFYPISAGIKGIVKYYIGLSPIVNPPNIFWGRFITLYANTDHTLTEHKEVTVVFCDYKRTDGTLTPLGANNIKIPKWSEAVSNPSLNYFISGLAGIQQADVGPDTQQFVALIVNNTAYFGLNYADIIAGNLLNSIIPYQSLDVTGDNGGNTISYLVDNLGNGFYSKHTSLPTGVPIEMPNPNNTFPPAPKKNDPPAFVTPFWYGAKDELNHKPPALLTFSDLSITHNNEFGFEILIEYGPGIAPGDIINVFAYVNGYDSAGNAVTQVFGDGSSIPGFKHATNVYTFTAYDHDIFIEPNKRWHYFVIDGHYLETVGRSTTGENGYLWLDYQVIPVDKTKIENPLWSYPYMAATDPVRFNFTNANFDTAKTVK